MNYSNRTASPGAGRRARLARRVHAHRVTMIREVHRTPGLTATPLRGRVGLGWGTFYHHLRILIDGDALTVVSSGKRSLIYPRSAGPSMKSASRQALLAGETARRVAAVAVAMKPISAARLAAEADISVRAARYHMRRLADQGLVQTVGNERSRSIEPTEELLRLCGAS